MQTLHRSCVTSLLPFLHSQTQVRSTFPYFAIEGSTILFNFDFRHMFRKQIRHISLPVHLSHIYFPTVHFLLYPQLPEPNMFKFV